MAEDTDSLILSISADVTQVQRALKRLTSDSKATTDAMVKGFTGVTPAVDRTAASIAKVDKAMAQSSKATSFAVTNLRFQLSDLSTQILSGGSPFMALQQQMGQISGAMSGLSRGAAIKALGSALISPWTLIPTAIGVATLAMQTFFDDVDKGSAEAAADLKTVADEAENLARIFPGSRFAQEFAKGARQAASDADALTARIKLQEAALADARAGFDNLVPGIADAIELLKQAGDSEGANRLTAAYNALGKALETGVGIGPAVAATLKALNNQNLQAADSAQELTQSLAAQQAVFADAAKNVEDTRIALGAYYATQNKVTAAMEAGNDAAAKYTAALDKMKNPAQLLAEALRKIGEAMPDFSVGGTLLKGAFELPGLAREAVSTNAASARTFLAGRTSEKFAARLDQYSDEFVTKLAHLFTLLPDTARIGSGVRTFAEQADIRASGVRPAAPAGSSHHEQRGDLPPSAADITGVSPETLQRAVAMVPGLETLARIGDANHVQLEGQARAAKEASTAYDDLYAANQKRLEQAQAINKINADGTLTDDQRTAALDRQAAAAEQAQIAEQLLAAAKTQGLTITPQLTADINAQAQAMAAAGLQAKQTAIDITKAAKDQADAQAQAMDAAQAVAAIGSTFMSTFISDLREGKDASEAFADALSNVVDQLIQMGLQSLFDPKNFLGMFAGVGGGTIAAGIPGPWGASLEQGGIVGARGNPMVPMDPRHFAGARSYARGGFPGMPPGAIPIYAHPGEMVVPKSMVARSGVGAGVVDNSTVINSGNIAIDMAATGLVAGSTRDAKQLGEMIKRSTQAILVQESRPGGILRKVDR